MDTSDFTTNPLKCCSRKDACVHPNGCWQNASSTHFSRDKKRRDGFHPQCKACVKAYQQSYSLNHADRILAYREQHREDARRVSREWRANNRERDRANAIRWRKENPDKFLEYRQSEAYKPIRVTAQQRQRARLRALPHSFTRKDWVRALEYFDNRCAVCNRLLSGLFHTAAADHWIPITSPDCPGTVPTNIVPLCDNKRGGTGACNELKQNYDPASWLTSRYGKRKAGQILARVEVYFQIVKTLEA